MQINQFSFILLRGLAREKRHWGAFTAFLTQASFCKECIPIDLPGFGEYDHLHSPLKISTIGDFIAERVTQVCKDQPTILVAISLGGMVGQYMVQKYPHLFSGLVLINSSFSNLSPPWKRLRMAIIPYFFWQVLCRPPASRELGIAKLVTNKPEAQAKVGKLWQQIALEKKISLINFARQLFAAGTFKAKLAVEQIPTLILASRKDRLVSWECSAHIAQFLDSEVYYHSEAGHDLPADDPEWIIENLAHWIEDLYRQNNNFETS